MNSIALAAAGAPLLVAEVASTSTVRNDVGEKRQAYAAIGVPEYLVFDPDGVLLPTAIQAWRLEAGIYVPWEPRADGRWYSTTLEVAFAPTQPFLGVRDRDGAAIELPSVVRARVYDLERQLDALDRARAEADRARAEADRARAEAEQAREEEARRRAALEEELRRLRPEQDG